MTDGEGRARFQYAESPEGQEQQEEEVQEEVRLTIPTAYRNDAPGHDADPGGGHDDEEEEEEEEVERRRSRSGTGQSDGAEWSPEVQEHEDQEPELEVEVGPTLGVRIRAPIRDPDCVSEEEEQQPYPALAPVAFICLKQTTRPRNWCLRVVCNPYPFTCWKPYCLTPGKTKYVLSHEQSQAYTFPLDERYVIHVLLCPKHDAAGSCCESYPCKCACSYETKQAPVADC